MPDIKAAEQRLAQAQQARRDKRRELEKAMAETLEGYMVEEKAAEAALQVLREARSSAPRVGTKLRWTEIQVASIFPYETREVPKQGVVKSVQHSSNGIAYLHVTHILKNGELGTRQQYIEFEADGTGHGRGIKDVEVVE